VTDLKPWIKRAANLDRDDTTPYATFSQDLVSALGWTAATDIATAIRSHVYGTPEHSDLHAAVRPIYDALGWQQSALVACWFRDHRNRADERTKQHTGRQPVAARLELPTSGRRPGGWPVAASHDVARTEIS